VAESVRQLLRTETWKCPWKCTSHSAKSQPDSDTRRTVTATRSEDSQRRSVQRLAKSTRIFASLRLKPDLMAAAFYAGRYCHPVRGCPPVRGWTRANVREIMFPSSGARRKQSCLRQRTPGPASRRDLPRPWQLTMCNLSPPRASVSQVHRTLSATSRALRDAASRAACGQKRECRVGGSPVACVMGERRYGGQRKDGGSSIGRAS
jgi:hypothetical protein